MVKIQVLYGDNFRDAPLQAAEKRGNSWETASFRLAGHAPARAIAWRGYKQVYFDTNEGWRAGMRGGGTPDARLTGYMPGQPIELDLTFLPPTPD